jgi:hypothetical protein
MRPLLTEWSGKRLHYLSPRDVINRFGWQAPSQRGQLLPNEARAFAEIEKRVPRQDGPVAVDRRPFPSAADATATIKQRARELGAHQVGVTTVDPRYVYEGRSVPHAFTVVIAVAMDYERF